MTELLRKHLQGMALNSPPESFHALDLEALREPEITFWSVWEGVELLGCGPLKELDGRHTEIKPVRTAAPHRRKGVATRLLKHILAEAKQNGYRRISLETAAGDASAATPQL